MMFTARRAVLFLALTLGVGACAAATEQTAAPPPFDPAGTWDFTTQFQGTPVTGTLILRRDADGALGGSIATNLTGTLQLRSVTLEGRRAVLQAPTPDGELNMHVDFEADRITGGWELTSGASGAVTGQRRPQGG